MQLTIKERLMLANQYSILALLNKDERAYYERCVEALRDGYEWFYDDLVTWYSEGDSIVTEEEGSFVIAVLSMFESLHFAIDRHGLPEGVEPYQVTFAGFDGNNESKYMGFAKFFCDRPHDKRFQTIIKDGFDFNSHCPSLETYERMLKAFKAVRDEHEISVDDVKNIASEHNHPSNR